MSGEKSLDERLLKAIRVFYVTDGSNPVKLWRLYPSLCPDLISFTSSISRLYGSGKIIIVTDGDSIKQSFSYIPVYV